MDQQARFPKSEQVGPEHRPPSLLPCRPFPHNPRTHHQPKADNSLYLSPLLCRRLQAAHYSLSVHHSLHTHKMAAPQPRPVQPQVQPCRYKTGKTLGAGSYSVVKECVHIETGRYYAAKVINKRLMQGREHMVRTISSIMKVSKADDTTRSEMRLQS